MFKETKFGDKVVAVSREDGTFVLQTDPEYLKWKNGDTTKEEPVKQPKKAKAKAK
jgi:hypothetical protein